MIINYPIFIEPSRFMEGISFETLFFQELKAINDALDLNYTISYWRTSNNTEVDFVLYGTRGLRAFEIKRTGKISKPMLSGLKAFLNDYPMAKAYFIYGGKRYMRQDGIEVIPMADALKSEAAYIYAKGEMLKDEK